MSRLLTILAGALAALCLTTAAVPASAQIVPSQRYTFNLQQTCDNGTPATRCTLATPVVNPDGTFVGGSTPGTGAASQQVQGAGGSGATAVGNPVGVGGVYFSTLPTLTNGQRGDLGLNSRGSLLVASAQGFAPADATTNNALGAIVDIVGGGRPMLGASLVFNGTTWDRMRTIQGADGTGLGVQAVALTPTSAATSGLASVRNVAVGSAQVLKASAGNLYDWQVTSGASAGYVMVFNATTAPADGAVTPAQCVAVAANATVGSSFNIVPEYYSTGVVVVFSTTGCFTKTASATAFIRGRAQ